MFSVFSSGVGSRTIFLLHWIMLISLSLQPQWINESITSFQTCKHTPVSFKIKLFFMSGFLTAAMHHESLCYEQTLKIQVKFLSQDSPDKALTEIFYSLGKASRFQCSQISLRVARDSFAKLTHVNFPPNTMISPHKWQQHLHPLHPKSSRWRSARLTHLATATEKLQYVKCNFTQNYG